MISQQHQNDNKRIGVFIPSALTESFEIVLARCVELNKVGADLYLIICSGEFSGCVANPLSVPGACSHCVQIQKKAISENLPKSTKIILQKPSDKARKEVSSSISEEIKNSSESTVLTFYRTKPNIITQNPLKKYLFEYIYEKYNEYGTNTYASLIGEKKIRDLLRIEFFNGRINPTRAVMLAAKTLNIGYSTIEVSGLHKLLFVTDNESVHDLTYHRKEIMMYASSKLAHKEIGVSYFEAKRNGISTNDISHIQKQVKGALSLHNDLPIIAIFTSSADEQEISGDQWFTEASKNPILFIEELAKSLAGRYNIVIRMHPNQAGDKTGEAERMIKVFSKNKSVHLIRPNDIQSTYELIDQASCVLSFSSTVGLEATYWGKPSILAGRAPWDQLDIAYYVESTADVVSLLSKKIDARSRDDAIKVGAFYMLGTGTKSALEYQKNGTTGFSVNGKSYLSEKRSSAIYWVIRVIDKVLRLV